MLYVFDAYGTLFDVHAAIARHRADVGPDADRLSELWRTKQLEYTWTCTLAGRYANFWTLTGQALDFALERYPEVDKGLRDTLLDAYKTLNAFPDAQATLEILKGRGHRTAILSNGSPDMLTSAVTTAGLADLLDAVLSVDRLRLYKPSPQVYGLVLDQFPGSKDSVTFVSSNRWDVMGAVTYGFQAVWINRSRMPDEYHGAPPLRTVFSLKDSIAS